MAPRAERALILAALLSLGCRGRAKAPEAPPPPPPPVTIALVGDILMHEDVKRSAAAAPGGFRDLWASVEPTFQAADLVIGNLETPVAPRTGRPGAPFMFNAPADLLKALKESGFHVLTVANNHAFDQGTRGLLETCGHLSEVGLGLIGGGPDQARAEAPLIVERRGLRIALLGRTDLFNANLNKGPEAPHVAALDLSRTAAAVREARTQADAVLVIVHWGNEYQHKPTPRQRQAARDLIAAGADAVIGHHPHVLQPMELVEAGGRRGVVAYSLGNFISNQDRMYDPDRQKVEAGDNRDGAAVVLTFRQGHPGVLLEARAEALWTDNNWRDRQTGRTREVLIRTQSLPAAQQGAQAEGDAGRLKVLEQRAARIQAILGQTRVGLAGQ